MGPDFHAMVARAAEEQPGEILGPDDLLRLGLAQMDAADAAVRRERDPIHALKIAQKAANLCRDVGAIPARSPAALLEKLRRAESFAARGGHCFVVSTLRDAIAWLEAQASGLNRGECGFGIARPHTGRTAP